MQSQLQAIQGSGKIAAKPEKFARETPAAQREKQ
jgi:hypothetical protein